ncbi:MAG: hypothetical protein LBI10_10090 [Deltaproteobacteria bacterium]|jgi:hypothetical protein|nr:hypothetical protein [Deltaproteobacteria bacterium]
MLVPSDYIPYVNRKKYERGPFRALIEAPLAAAPGGGRKKSDPIEPALPKKERPVDQEVDYLNARPSTLDVVL